jgi:hypothetical protein
VAQQATQGEESHRSGAWPTGRRLHKAGAVALLKGIVQWQRLNAMPQLAAANDNTVDRDLETVRRDAVSADEIAAAIELEKEHPGEYWKPETLEVFVRDKWRSLNDETEFDRKHSSVAPGWLSDEMDEEDKRAQALDCQRIRARLGAKTCCILDAASTNATLNELAEIIGCSRKTTDVHVDAAIEEFLKIAA